MADTDTPTAEQIVAGLVEERIPDSTVTRLTRPQHAGGAWMAWYRLPMGEAGAVRIPGHVVAPHL